VLLPVLQYSLSRQSVLPPLSTVMANVPEDNNSSNNGGGDDGEESCLSILSKCEMFSKVPQPQLANLASAMTYRVFPQNSVLLEQGQISDKFFLIQSGAVKRHHVTPYDGKKHQVEFALKGKSINSMRILEPVPVYTTVTCVTKECRVFEMQRSKLLQVLHDQPETAVHIASGLCEQLRIGCRKYQTPMLEQGVNNKQEVNIPAVSIGAGIESFYRSALNSLLNARLTGVRADLFPNMHIQVPSRIAYITGFKGLRAYLDKHVHPEQYQYPTTVRLLTAVTPGIIMTPISSLLEASNAGHMNKEPMSTRWMRGLVPRAGREIIFGIGLNQMSDYFEERINSSLLDDGVGGQQGNSLVANAAGSMLAGVVSGYLSHIPHNMSTYKLMDPTTGYGTLYSKFVDKSVPPWIDNCVSNWPSSTRTAARYFFATLFPRGIVIRTTQIVGSFIILNGTINYLQLREQHKIQRAMEGGGSGE